MRGFFITGTDTGVGKTQTACLIARQLAARELRVGAYKPVCSGAEFDSNGQPFWDDIRRLSTAINVPAGIDEICPQRFLAPLAPPLAAAQEERKIDDRLLTTGADVWQGRADLLLVEGAGGLLCPLTATRNFADYAVELGFPLIIVARPGLGTINHTLLTIEAARSRRLAIAGIVFCQTMEMPDDPSVATNAAEIERRSGVPVFGTIPFGNEHELICHGKSEFIPWESLAAGNVE